MTARVVHLDTDTHNAVQGLLPWYAADTLDAADRARVEAHLAACQRCQAELEWERKLRCAHGELGAPAGSGDVEQGLARLHRRMAASPPRQRRGAWHRWLERCREAWGDSAPWLRWTMAAQTAVIALLGIALLFLPPSLDESYRALGTPGQAAGNAVVMFRPGASEQTLRDVLQASGARLVGGPTAAGAYVLDIPPAQLQAALGRLRAQPSVALAESLGARTAP